VTGGAPRAVGFNALAASGHYSLDYSSSIVRSRSASQALCGRDLRTGMQLDAVLQARSAAPSDSATPVVAAAQAVSAFAEDSPTGATFLLLVTYDELLKEDVRDDLRDRILATHEAAGRLVH
jgi:hypothetical protein